MAVNKLDPKIIFASEAPAQDVPAVFANKTVGWGESRKNGGRPTIKQSNALQQETDLKILWLNENSVTPYDATIDYPVNAVTLKDGTFKIFNGSVWNIFLTKASVGLGNVDNTSDLGKPISTATQSVLNGKAAKTYVDTNLALKADLSVVKRGIGNIYDPTLTYNENERVILLNGDVVKSTISNNTNNPNTNMTGWILVSAKNPSTTVDSIAELIAIPNPKNGQVVFVKGYHLATNFALAKPYKGGGDFEYRANASDNVNDGTIFKPNDNDGRWFRIAEGDYNASWFGVKGLGQTGDQQCISKAYEYLNSIGGGTLNLDDGVYLIDTINYAKEAETGPSLNEQYAFPIYSNITVQGESRENTIFKMADGIIYKDLYQANIGCALFADAHKRIDIENFTIKNFKVDMNGINNTVVDLPTTGVSGVQQAIFPVLYFFDYYNSKNITVDNIWVHQNSGMNSIYIGHKSINPTIQNCLFTDHSDYIVGNDHIKDHSTIYMCGLDGKVHNNRFIMSRNAVSNVPRERISYISTAIEAHGVNTIVSNNIVDGYGAPFLAASTEWYNGDRVLFTGNTAYDAGVGFCYNSMNGQLRADFVGNKVFLRKQKASTSDNNIRYVHAAIESGGAINSILDRASAYSEIYVLNNVFEQEEPTDWIDSDKFINTCHNVKEAKLFVSKGNTFKNFKGSALSVLQCRDWLESKIILDSNSYINCGQDSSYHGYRAAYYFTDSPRTTDGGYQYNLLDSVTVTNDVFVDCSYGVLASRLNTLTAKTVNITGIKYTGAFIPPVLIGTPVDMISGHTINIEYVTVGAVTSGQNLGNFTGVSGKAVLQKWSPTNVDDFLLQNISYVKTPYFGWNMRALSSNIPSNSVQFGAFPNKDGDRIEAVGAPPASPSSYIRSNSAWYGVGVLNTPI